MLGIIARDFVRTGAQARALQASLAQIRLMAAGGALMLGAGAAGLYAVGKMVDHAKEYAHQLALMNTAGMTHLEIIRATNAAWATSRGTPTSTAAENLAAVRELRMVFGNTSDAIRYMPPVQRLQAILGTLRGTDATDEAYTVAKALEMKGAVRTPAEFTKQADLMAKAIVAAGGKIGATDFLSAFKYGRSATLGWSDAFTYTILPTLIQEMKTAGGGGGSGTGGPGNALMSAYAAVVGGVISQRALKVWEKLGLLDPSKIEWTKVGEAKGVRPGGVRGVDLFQQNPKAWVDQYLIPAMRAHGFTDDKKMREAIQYMFPNRTAGFVMGQLALQGWKFDRDVRLINQAQGLAAYDQLLKTDPMMAQLALQKQWNNLLAILGFQIMPVLLPLMLDFTNWLSGLARWMTTHQTAAWLLVGTFTALSAVLAFSGSVLLLTAAFRGLALILGVGAATGAGASVAGGAATAALALGRLVPILGAIGLAAYLWDKPPSKSAFWNDPHFVDKKVASLWSDVTGIFGRGLSFDAPRKPQGQFEIEEAAAKKRNDELIDELRKLFTNIGVYIDGKLAGQIISAQQAKQVNQPAQRGLSRFNPTAARSHP